MQDLLSHAPTKHINVNKLSDWLGKGLNVLLVGSHGVGKTSLILETFRTKLGTNWAFFNGATTDPWTDLIGIPAINKQNGIETIKYIRPEELNDDIEAIYVDELNRAKVATRNALLELIQFKSINGRKFPKLRAVWASVNPPKSSEAEDFEYDVEALDPAQTDRFHIIIKLSDEPDSNFFSKNYQLVGENLVRWWHRQPTIAKKLITPRRLEYIAQVYNEGLDIADVIPTCANVKELKTVIGLNPVLVDFERALKKDKEKVLEIADANKKIIIAHILQKKLWDVIPKLSPAVRGKILLESVAEVQEYAKNTKNRILLRIIQLHLNRIDKVEAEKVQKILEAMPTVGHTSKVLKRGSEEHFEQYLNTAIVDCKKEKTYHRRKAISELSRNFPDYMDVENIPKLETLVSTWCEHAQGYSIRACKKHANDSRYNEVLTIGEIIKHFLIPNIPDHQEKSWYTKFTGNGYTF